MVKCAKHGIQPCSLCGHKYCKPKKCWANYDYVKKGGKRNGYYIKVFVGKKKAHKCNCIVCFKEKELKSINAK